MQAGPKLIQHPGAFIKDELASRNWEQSDLAFIIGKLPQQLNKIVAGKGSITPEWAALLGNAFNIEPEFFLNLQAQYDLRNSKSDEAVQIRAQWAAILPVREMIKRGWIEESDAYLLQTQMHRFLNIHSIDDLEHSANFAYAAKKTSYEVNTPLQLAWVSRVKAVAQLIAAPSYSESKLRETLPVIRAHMNDADDFAKIPELLLKCGVRLIFVEALAGSKIDGVCTWTENKQPIIGLSLRFPRADNFCFVLRHEIEHVLQKDGMVSLNIDSFEDIITDEKIPESERHANKETQEYFIPEGKLDSFLLRKGKFVSERDVLAFSSRIGIHPAIIVGQIQRRKHEAGEKNAYGFLRKYLVDVRDILLQWDYKDGWGYIAPVSL